MITEQDLKEAIAECQGTRDPNANTCIKLAAYYIILDHIKSVSDTQPVIPKYSYAPAPSNISNTIDSTGESDFSKKINGMNCNDVIGVFSELMDTLSILNPGLYNGVMRKLSQM